MRLFLLVLSLIVMVGGPACAEKTASETLDFKLPKGWSADGLGGNLDNADMGIGAEMMNLNITEKFFSPTPDKLKDDTWTRRIAITSFRRSFSVPPAAYVEGIMAAFNSECSYGKVVPFKPRRDGNKFILQGYYVCAQEKTAPRSTITMYKYIDGEKRTYFVARDLRGKPFSPAVMAKFLPTIPKKFASWMAWFETVRTVKAGEKPKLIKAGTGTGFAVTDHHIVTNNHVAGRCRAIQIPGVGRAKLLARDKKLDLALLRVKKTLPKAPVFHDSGDIRIGQDVLALGFPLGDALSTDLSVTTGIVNNLTGLKDDKNTLRFSAPVSPGNSGGPLLSSKGMVVGVVTAIIADGVAQNINFAITADTVRTFLAKHKVDLRVVSTKKVAVRSHKVADIAEAGRAYTVSIECWQ